jgi:hypothetical protein
MKYSNKLRALARSIPAKITAGGTALVASAAAMASGGGDSPGAAMAGELASGKTDVGLVVAAVAVILGFIILWRYTKKVA